MYFLGLGVYKKVVDKGLIYLHMHFQPNGQGPSQVNGQKLSKTLKKAIFDDFDPILTSEDVFFRPWCL